MRNLRKSFAVLVVIAMLVGAMVPAFAAAEYTYSDAADSLHNLGLYKGVSTTSFDADLGNTVDRQTAVVLLMRMFGLGKESKADEAATPENTSKLAATFTDAGSIKSFAVNAVAYAVEKGYVAGMGDGTFAPASPLVGKAYCKLVLSLLGYKQGTDFQYDAAGTFFAETAPDTEDGEDAAFNVAAPIKKDTMVGISYRALSTSYKDVETTIIDKLVADKVVEQAKAEEEGFDVAVVTTPAASTTPGASSETSATPVASSVPTAVYGSVKVKLGTSPSMMAQSVSDFNIANLVIENSGTVPATFGQITVEMDRFLGNNTKVSDIKIWDGATRVSPGTPTWSTNVYSSILNISRPVTVAAGESKTLKVTADIASAVLGEQYKFTFKDAKFGDAFVEGMPLLVTPIQVTVVDANTTINVVDDSKTAASENMAIGVKNVTVGQFKISAPSDEDINITALKITNGGAGVSSEEVDTVDIYKGDVKVGTAAYDQKAEFSPAVNVKAGEDVVLTVKLSTTNDIDSGNTYKPTIADVKDMDITGTKFMTTLELASTVNGKTTWTVQNATVKVSGVGSAQATSALQTASDFKLGTVYVNNNNVEDVKMSTLKVNIRPTTAGGATTTLNSATSLRNFELVDPNGTKVANSTDLGRLIDAAYIVANGVIDGALNDYVITFTLNNEYLIKKNTEVAFNVICDVPTVVADATDKVTLTYYQGAGATHLSVIGQSSFNSITGSDTASAITGNPVQIKASAGQSLTITEATDWDAAAAEKIAEGNDRVVANWKIKEGTLEEDANVTELVLTNASAGTNVSTFYTKNLRLYYNDKLVSTVAVMAADGTVTFGDGETTLFTVANGDDTGKSLVVKADFDEDITAAAQDLDLQLAALGDLTAEGASTYATINASATVALANDKAVVGKSMTVAKQAVSSTSIPYSAATELYRFTVTPDNGKTIDMSDIAILLTDALGTTRVEAIALYDYTNSRTVTLAPQATEVVIAGGTTTIPNVASTTGFAVGQIVTIYQADGVTLRGTATISAITANTSITFTAAVAGLVATDIITVSSFNNTADVTITVNDANYNAIDKATTFIVRANTSALTASNSYQIGIKATNGVLQVTGATEITGDVKINGSDAIGTVVTATY